MKWFVFFILIFMVSFVSGAYPEDYSFSVHHNDAIWNWVVRDPVVGFLYPDSDVNHVGGGNLYTHLLDGSVEFDFSDVSTSNFVLSSGPVNWYPAIEGVNSDGDFNTHLDARIRLQFLDSVGGVLQFHDANTQPSDPDVEFISSGCNYRTDAISPYSSIMLEDNDFDESCEFQILDPNFKSQVNSIRVTYEFDLAIRASSRPYFNPVIEGPIEPYLVEICDSFPFEDEDRDGFNDCLDPDCNGQISGGPVSPSMCAEDHIAYDGGPLALTWGGLDWINTEAYGCTGVSGGFGYCCPLWWDWDAGLGRCISPETCDNGIDDDFDGDTDCEDSDCATFNDCMENKNGQCGDGVDNDLDGFTDCEDSDCTLVGVQDWSLILGDYSCDYNTQSETICGPSGCNGFHCDQNSFVNFCCPITQDLDFVLSPPSVECVGALPPVGICGDGNIDTPNNVGLDELCDGSNLDGNDCTDFGFLNPAGLGCLADCSDFNTSACNNVVITTPPVGPNEYLVYNDDCMDDGNGDQYGVNDWTLYDGDGNVLNSDTSLCLLYNSDAPFVGTYSILLFFIVIFGFYFRERYLNDN